VPVPGTSQAGDDGGASPPGRARVPAPQP
jgi:hypothetical protein